LAGKNRTLKRKRGVERCEKNFEQGHRKIELALSAEKAGTPQQPKTEKKKTLGGTYVKRAIKNRRASLPTKHF